MSEGPLKNLLPKRPDRTDRPDRIFRQLGKGGETSVWTHRRGQDGKEGRTVLKDFDEDDDTIQGDEKNILWSGITEQMKIKLTDRYNALRAQYGDLIARQWIINIPELHKGPTDNGKYVVSQEKIETAEPSDIFHYQPNQLSDPVRQQLQDLVQKLKDSYQLFLQAGPSANNAPIDLRGSNNLIITTHDELKYIDVGLSETTYEHRNQLLLLERFVARLAVLDYIAYDNVESVLSDPCYQALWKHYNEYDQTRMKDPLQFKNILLGTTLNP